MTLALSAVAESELGRGTRLCWAERHECRGQQRA